MDGARQRSAVLAWTGKIDLRVSARAKRVLKYLLETLAIGTVVFALYAYNSRDLLTTELQEAPDLRAMMLDGSDFDFAKGSADTTLIYFFAPWCKICSASSGNINFLRRVRSETDLQILLVVLDWQSPDEVHEYVSRNEITVPVLLGNRRIAEDWNIYAYPTYYTLDSERRLKHRDLGYSTFAGLWWRTL